MLAGASLRNGVGDIDDIDHAGKMRRGPAMAAGLQNTVNSSRPHGRHRLIGKAPGLFGFQRTRPNRIEQILRPRQERGIQFEAGIFRRRADQRDRAILDKGQKTVLLRPVEAMNLIHEEQRLRALARMVPGRRKHLLEVGDARKHRRDRLEPHAHRVGEQARYRRLAGTRRSPEDDGGQASGRDHAADRAVRSGQMLLPDDIGQCARAQPVGQRGGVARLVGGGIILRSEQVGHRHRYRRAWPIREQGWNAGPGPARAGG
mgnify:CR=1 FL=1